MDVDTSCLDRTDTKLFIPVTCRVVMVSPYQGYPDRHSVAFQTRALHDWSLLKAALAFDE